jgi:hypothetical protein
VDKTFIISMILTVISAGMGVVLVALVATDLKHNSDTTKRVKEKRHE